MKSKHRVLFRLVMAVLVQVLLMTAAEPLYAQPDLRNVPWANKTPEDRLIIKTLEIASGKVEIKGGLMVAPVPAGLKGIFKAPTEVLPLKIASGIGYHVANHSTSRVWLTVQVNAPGEEKRLSRTWN